MRIAREEIFGPVLSVIRARDLDHALEIVNHSEHGNASSIYTKSGAAARHFSANTQTGMVGVNLGVPAPVAMFPFSGWKNSFFGDLHALGKAQFPGGSVDPALAAAALRLQAPAVAGTALPVQVVSCGVPFLFVPLTTRRAVDNASLDSATLDDLYAAAGAGEVGIFLFSKEPGPDHATVYSRMFAPNLGVAEDPATGSASGPLGCYLVRHKLVAPDNAGSMLSLQGAVQMGRAELESYLGIAADAAGAVTSVQVGGEAGSWRERGRCYCRWSAKG